MVAVCPLVAVYPLVVVPTLMGNHDCNSLFTRVLEAAVYFAMFRSLRDLAEILLDVYKLSDLWVDWFFFGSLGRPVIGSLR